jgi:hypothetical protein
MRLNDILWETDGYERTEFVDIFISGNINGVVGFEFLTSLNMKIM